MKRGLYDDDDDVPVWVGGPPPVCPRCGSREVVGIVYGFVDDFIREFAARGECVIGGNDGVADGGVLPSHACSRCGDKFVARQWDSDSA